MSYEVIATGLKFPEGPIWMPDGSVVLVEIALGRLSRVQPDGTVETVSELGGGPNGAAIGPDGKCYVCNSGGFNWIEIDGLLYPEGTAPDYAGGRIERVDLETGEFDTVYTECAGNPLSGPNDIVFDSEGGFWFTDTGKMYPRNITRGGLYYAKTDGSHIEEVIYPLDLPNGVALSPEEDRVYFCETLCGRLWQYPLDGVGKLAAGTVPGNPENLHHAPGGIRGFDSMAVDGAGNVCQATVFEGGISVVSPDGELVDFVSLPDPLITNICFGGDDLQTAYITMSGTGQLIKMPWPHSGHRLNF